MLSPTFLLNSDAKFEPSTTSPLAPASRVWPEAYVIFSAE